MSKGNWGERHALFKRFAVGEVVRNEDGALIAKLLKVEKGGKSMQIAVLDLIDESCCDLISYNGRTGQTLEDVKGDSHADEEGKRILKIEDPDFIDDLQITVNNLCLDIYVTLKIIKEETDWAKLRDGCEYCVKSAHAESSRVSDAYKKGLPPKEEDVEQLYQSRRKEIEDKHQRYHAYVAELQAVGVGIKKPKAEKESKKAAQSDGHDKQQ